MKDKWYIEKINGENYIYHCFTFDPKIQEHTFLGNEFIGIVQADEVDVINTFERIVDAGPEGFMPRLVEELQYLFGEGNYIYDGYELVRTKPKYSSSISISLLRNLYISHC